MMDNRCRRKRRVIHKNSNAETGFVLVNRINLICYNYLALSILKYFISQKYKCQDPIRDMFKLPELPYSPQAFPHQLSPESFEYHHGKHHLAYINNLNTLIKGTQWEKKALDQIVLKCNDQKILNNAQQHWNHSFFWNCISPFKSQPEGQLLKAVQAKWKSVDALSKELIGQAVANFGSGWTWLCKKNKQLFIINTSNAQNPLRNGYEPLLTIDIWQHAYYIDYRNARSKYLQTLVQLINWNFVNNNFKRQQTKSKL